MKCKILSVLFVSLDAENKFVLNFGVYFGLDIDTHHFPACKTIPLIHMIYSVYKVYKTYKSGLLNYFKFNKQHKY